MVEKRESNRDGRTATRRTGTRRAAAILTSIAMLTAGTLLATTGTAGASNGGSVMCVNQAPVVGVWVNVQGGRSGWAGRSGSGFQQGWAYNTQGRPYSLTVGCGGSPARWASSSSTTSYRRDWTNINCYPGWVYGGASLAVHDRCFAG